MSIRPTSRKLELYEKSGHYPHYKDSMYAPIEIDDEKFMLRPMTCPHHFELYLAQAAQLSRTADAHRRAGEALSLRAVGRTDGAHAHAHILSR